MALQQVPNAKTKRGYDVYKIEDLSDFISYIEGKVIEGKIRDEFMIFRGQREDWPLVPKVARFSYRRFPGSQAWTPSSKCLTNLRVEPFRFCSQRPEINGTCWQLLSIMDFQPVCSTAGFRWIVTVPGARLMPPSVGHRWIRIRLYGGSGK